MRSDAFTRAIASFATLPATDRRAIEKHLSASERRALRELLVPPKQQKPKRASAPAPAKPDVKGLSPRLGRRINDVLDTGRDKAAKPAARAAIGAVLAARKGAP